MSYKLVATYKPTGEVFEYGPWPADPNPSVAVARLSFAQGFVSGGNYFMRGGDFAPEEMEFKVIEVDEGANTIGSIQAFASASVTHADGTTD